MWNTVPFVQIAQKHLANGKLARWLGIFIENWRLRRGASSTNYTKKEGLSPLT